MVAIPATWMRGGTSKCWVFEGDALNIPGKTVDEVLLRLFGSPDFRQVDGIGGGTSTTSKAVILSRSENPDADVDYTFAQVGTDEMRVGWGSNCGNCSAVVAPYAIERGWVNASDGSTAVRILNTNTNQLILQKVLTPGGKVPEVGNHMIPGVPFPSLPVGIGFIDPAGKTTGRLFPTGRQTETLTFKGHPVPATLIDAGAPVVILPAEAIGLTGHETAAEIDGHAALLESLDEVRREAAVLMGLANVPEAAERAIPKLAFVARPIDGDEADLSVRMMSMGKLHPSLAITGSVALTMAAQEDTVVSRALRDHFLGKLSMRTPAGLVQTWMEDYEGTVVVGTVRSSRRIANAELLLPSAW